MYGYTGQRSPKGAQCLNQGQQLPVTQETSLPQKLRWKKDVRYCRRQDWARSSWVQTLLAVPPAIVLLSSWCSQSPEEHGHLFPKASVFTLELYGG